MLNLIDQFLDRITMYRLVLYYLTALIFIAAILSFFGKLPFSPFFLLFSLLLITGACWITNTIFARVFNVPANVESVYITAFILVLIITPLKSLADLQYLVFISWAAILSQASKYIFALRKKHIFNPAACAVALTALSLNQPASWWVGTSSMVIFALLGGLLVTRKIRRFGLVTSFVIASLLTISGFSLLRGGNIFNALHTTLLNSSFLFFVFVMLTEPLTTPPTKKLQIWYGALVGFLFAPQVHFGSIFSTPELALLAGNVYSYLVSPKEKLVLALRDKIKITADSYDFVFGLNKKLNFRPGQYMEWTLGHNSSDSRGNRRYFTLASSPTETNLRIGVKFYKNSSSFKSKLGSLQNGDTIVAGQLAGDFTLPKDPKEKLVFIAGGIGVTPFRSMIKYLLDTSEKRPIIFFYSNKTAKDIAYKNIFDQASKKLGIKTIYNLTDLLRIPPGWQGNVGHIGSEQIFKKVPDFRERVFYLSGPQSMIFSFEQTLKKLGVPNSQIKKDFFPGLV